LTRLTTCSPEERNVAQIFAVALVLDRTEALLDHHFGEPDDRIERGAYFMADARQELGFLAGGFLRGAPCGDQFGFGPLPVSYVAQHGAEPPAIPVRDAAERHEQRDGAGAGARLDLAAFIEEAGDAVVLEPRQVVERGLRAFRRQQLAELHVAQLVPFKPEQRLGAGVGALDGPGAVEDDHAIGGGVEDSGQFAKPALRVPFRRSGTRRFGSALPNRGPCSARGGQSGGQSGVRILVARPVGNRNEGLGRLLRELIAGIVGCVRVPRVLLRLAGRRLRLALNRRFGLRWIRTARFVGRGGKQADDHGRQRLPDPPAQAFRLLWPVVRCLGRVLGALYRLRGTAGLYGLSWLVRLTRTMKGKRIFDALPEGRRDLLESIELLRCEAGLVRHALHVGADRHYIGRRCRSGTRRSGSNGLLIGRHLFGETGGGSVGSPEAGFKGRRHQRLGRLQDAKAAVTLKRMVGPEDRQGGQFGGHPNIRTLDGPPRRLSAPGIAMRQGPDDPRAGVKVQPARRILPAFADDVSVAADDLGQARRNKKEPIGSVRLPKKADRLRESSRGTRPAETERPMFPVRSPVWAGTGPDSIARPALASADRGQTPARSESSLRPDGAARQAGPGSGGFGKRSRLVRQARIVQRRIVGLA
jgi:hypothetical protein